MFPNYFHDEGKKAASGRSSPGLGSFLALAVLLAQAGCVTESPDAFERQANYRHPLLSPGEEFGKLPAAVRNTIRAQAGAAPIRQIDSLITGMGAQVYAVRFENAMANPPLFVAEDGSVLDNYLGLVVGAPADEEGSVSGFGSSVLTLSDLPDPSITAIRNREPLGLITGIDDQTWGETTVYRVTFENPRLHPVLYVTAEGVVLKQEPR